MQRLVQELKQRYPDRYVIFDAPHLLRMPDSLVFSQFVEALLLVVGQDKTLRRDVEEALTLVEKDKVLGFAMNELP